MILALVVPCVLQLLTVQAELDFYIEDVEIEEISADYFDTEESTIELNEKSDGKNTISAKMIITQTLPEDLTGHIYMKGYSMGEYKADVGLDIKDDICDMLQDRMIVGPVLEVMGFSEDNCPPKEGTYEKDDYYPRMDFLPDSFPEGKYKVIFEVYHSDEIFFKIYVFIAIN